MKNPLQINTKEVSGAYFINSILNLAAGQGREWYIVAELNQGPSEVAALEKMLQDGGDLRLFLEDDIAKSSKNLARIVGSSDGLQLANHPDASCRHFSNVLFNLMRGGVFLHNQVAGQVLNPLPFAGNTVKN